MLRHVELDATFGLEQQYADSSGETTILVNLFDVDPKDQEYFKAAWRADAEFSRCNLAMSLRSSTRVFWAAACS